jgi:arylsulfatase A-like enzyme
VPAFFNWPSRLKPAVVDATVGMVDIMPTLLALAGAKGTDDHPLTRKGPRSETTAQRSNISSERATR